MKAVRHSLRTDPAVKQKSLLRLKRIEGQVRGVARMIGEERYCPDILAQLSAIHESLRGVAQLLLRNHLEHCATQAIRSGGKSGAAKTYDELTKLFYQYAR